MNISPLAFYVLAALAIGCALLVITKKNPVSSAFSLVLVLFSLAGIYAGLGSHLIAAMQVLVYAGAVMVLFVFVIMLLNANHPSLEFKETSWWTKSSVALLGLALLCLLVGVFKSGTYFSQPGKYTPEAIASWGGNTRVVAHLLFTEYLLPFEATSLLLLGAIVGTVAIAMRKKSESRKEIKS